MKKIIRLTESDLEKIIKRVISEQGIPQPSFGNSILKFDKIDEKRKVANDIDSIISKGKLLKRSSSYDKDFETLQKALILLGYELPEYGSDGKFGRETYEKLKSFQSSNGLDDDGIAGELTLKKISDLLRNKKTSSTQTTQPIITNEPQHSSSSGSWQQIAFDYIKKKESYKEKPRDDQGKYRGGYGSDTIIRNGREVAVYPGMIITKQEAEDTLLNYSIPSYSKQIIKDLGSNNWDKLNDTQKAALVSVGYNVGKYYIQALDFGKKIKSLITQNRLREAGETIYTDGPKTGKKSGYLPGLEKRRREESEMFLA